MDLIDRRDATSIPVLPKEHREYQTNNLDDAYELGWYDCQKYIGQLPSTQKTNDEIDPNDDLIKRQDAIEAVTKYCTEHDLRDLLADLEVLPSAEPERKTGKWIEFPNHMAYKCSECGRIIQTTDGRRNVSKHYPFCHCGARMECEEE